MKHILSAVTVVAFFSVSDTIARPVIASVHQGWISVKLADVSNTPDLWMRKQKRNFYLTASGDFDGNLLEDRLTIKKHERLGQYGIFVCFAQPNSASCKETLITSGPISDLLNLGVSAVAATDPECRRTVARGTSSCIEVFTFESGSALFRWNGSKFIERQIAD